MTCDKCGASNPTIHLTQIFSGVRTTHNFCEDCAPVDLRQTSQQIKSGTFDPEAQWQEKWERIHAEHPEYSCEAYSFVQKAIFHHHSKMDAQVQQGSGNILDLFESCQAYAKELYGESAKSQLEAWGVETFLDVGEIFILISSDLGNGLRSSDLEIQLAKMHEQMREGLRQKYGGTLFLSDES